jgi:ankyrin repeat protein
MSDKDNNNQIGAIEKARTLGLQKTSSNLARRALQDIERLTTDVNARDAEGQTPLHRAATRGYKDLVELLIAKGAEVNAKHKNGQTPLQMAASEGHKEVVEFLKKHGAR